MTDQSVADAAGREFADGLATVLDSAYGTALRLTGNEADAEDLVQDAALLAYRGFGGFRSGSNFRAWFYRILVNRFYSTYRRRRRAGVALGLDDVAETRLVERADAAGLAVGSDPAEMLLDRLDGELIEEAMQSLPDDFRAAAALYFLDDLSYQNIADALDIPVGTVRSRLHRARRLLQAALWRLAEERGIVSTRATEA